MIRRSAAVLLAMAVATLGACASSHDAAPSPTWTSLPLVATFGRQVEARPVAYVDHRYVAIGQRYASPRAQRRGATGVPLMWTSSDAMSWTPLQFVGLPRRPCSAGCGISWLTSAHGHHVLSWNTGNGARLYRSPDLVHWHRALSVPGSQFYEIGATTDGFLASFRIGPWDGPGTYEGYRSRDGRAWEKLPVVSPPAVSGLPAGAPLRDRYISVDRSDRNAERMMTSRDQRVWTPLAGPTPQHLELQLVTSPNHDFLGGEYFDMAHQESAKGVFVTSRDAIHWEEVRSFRRRFPRADLTAVVRIGRWWLVTGAIGDASGRDRPWPIWATDDLEHWRQQPREMRTRHTGEMRLHVVHDVVFGIPVLGTGPLVVFHPPDAA